MKAGFYRATRSSIFNVDGLKFNPWEIGHTIFHLDFTTPKIINYTVD